MTIEEMKELSSKRNKGIWTLRNNTEVQLPCHKSPSGFDSFEVDTCDGKAAYTAEFIIMAANNWDALIAVVGAAKALPKMWNISVMGDLLKALKDLEE